MAAFRTHRRHAAWARRARLSPGLGLIACLGLTACAVGPDYQRPSVPTPPAFKEAAGWTPAHPADAVDKGAWWSVFNDPLLDALERKVETSNQTLAAAQASYEEARAVVGQYRAQLFPAIALSGSATVSGAGRNSGVATASAGTALGTAGVTRLYQIGAQASWVPDLWGKVRREIEGAQGTAEASQADLANVRLTAQGELASDYIELRMTDAQKQLLQRTVSSYERSLAVTVNQYKAGRTVRSAVLTAETTLASARASLLDLDRQRTQAEHAIAVLSGQPPAELTIVPLERWSPTPPETPAIVPSALLQRRPDVAAAERSAAAANAQIGVAVAAYYPDLTLSASYGFASTAIGSLLRAPSSLWSLGATAADTVLDFGARKAVVAQSRAAYDVAVANYRQVVLTAFQNVEDALAASRILRDEQAFNALAADKAKENVALTRNEFQAGTVDYTTVATAQAAALSAEQSLLSLQAERMTAAVNLIEALGGGWSSEPVPK